MRVQVGQIADGLAGTEATLTAIFTQIEAGQVDPTIIRIVRESIGRTPFKRELRMLKKAVRGVLRNVQILEDPVRHEFVQEPRVTIETGRGDCDDLVGLVGAALEHLGFEVELLVGSQSRQRAADFTHVWLRAFLPIAGQWIPVDPRGMLQLGWRIGRELSPLTAIASYGWDEEAKSLTPGRSLMPRIARMGQMGRIRGRHRRRAGAGMGAFIETDRPSPSPAPAAPVALGPAIRIERRFKFPVRRRPGGPRRIIGTSAGMGRMMPAAMRNRGRLGQGGQAFRFVEQQGPIEGQATAAGAVADAAPTAVVIEQSETEKKVSKAISFLTLAFLGTGIVRNLSG